MDRNEQTAASEENAALLRAEFEQAVFEYEEHELFMFDVEESDERYSALVAENDECYAAVERASDEVMKLDATGIEALKAKATVESYWTGRFVSCPYASNTLATMAIVLCADFNARLISMKANRKPTSARAQSC